MFGYDYHLEVIDVWGATLSLALAILCDRYDHPVVCKCWCQGRRETGIGFWVNVALRLTVQGSDGIGHQ